MESKVDGAFSSQDYQACKQVTTIFGCTGRTVDNASSLYTTFVGELDWRGFANYPDSPTNCTTSVIAKAANMRVGVAHGSAAEVLNFQSRFGPTVTQRQAGVNT